jgi:hypothetical protein
MRGLLIVGGAIAATAGALFLLFPKDKNGGTSGDTLNFDRNVNNATSGGGSEPRNTNTTPPAGSTDGNRESNFIPNPFPSLNGGGRRPPNASPEEIIVWEATNLFFSEVDSFAQDSFQSIFSGN